MHKTFLFRAALLTALCVVVWSGPARGAQTKTIYSDDLYKSLVDTPAALTLLPPLAQSSPLTTGRSTRISCQLVFSC